MFILSFALLFILLLKVPLSNTSMPPQQLNVPDISTENPYKKGEIERIILHTLIGKLNFKVV